MCEQSSSKILGGDVAIVISQTLVTVRIVNFESRWIKKFTHIRELIYVCRNGPSWFLPAAATDVRSSGWNCHWLDSPETLVSSVLSSHHWDREKRELFGISSKCTSAAAMNLSKKPPGAAGRANDNLVFRTREDVHIYLLYRLGSPSRPAILPTRAPALRWPWPREKRDLIHTHALDLDGQVEKLAFNRASFAPTMARSLIIDW